jgi:hypothetical protein
MVYIEGVRDQLGSLTPEVLTKIFTGLSEAVSADKSADEQIDVDARTQEAIGILNELSGLMGNVANPKYTMSAEDIKECYGLMGKLYMSVTDGGIYTEFDAFTESKISECYIVIDEAKKLIDSTSGTAPDVIAEALKDFENSVILGSANDFSPDDPEKKCKLDYNFIVQKLDEIGTDRAIVCSAEHFLTLRKTTEDGWCAVDSVTIIHQISKTGDLPNAGKSFSGVIYSPKSSDDLGNHLIEVLNGR